MRARRTLRLPRPRDLKSNKLGDIQNMFRLLLEELDNQWKLLFQDIHIIQTDTDGFIYFGNKDTDGSWRIGRIGPAVGINATPDYVLEHRASGTWTTVELSHGA